MKTLAITIVVLVAVLAGGLLGTMFASSRTAENGCTNVADQRRYSSVTNSWSWSPFGTTCTFDGRVSETQLFW